MRYFWTNEKQVNLEKDMECCLFSDLTQEVASKGLGLVYEHGGGENKDELVSLLVDTLMTGSRWALN